jgi:hypothetical protein
MGRSVSLVDYKVQQAEFFFEKLLLAECDFFAFQCYSDAFVAACRSITFAIQSVCKEVVGFEQWYAEEQGRMKLDPLFEFFKAYRTASVHIGDTPVRSFSRSHGESRYFFIPTQDISRVPEIEVAAACRSYFSNIVGLVFRLYIRFRTDLDDRWYYTSDHFSSRGMSFEDALESLGYPRDWITRASDESESAEQWRLLRKFHTSGPVIQDIFLRYLSQTIEGPDEIQS